MEDESARETHESEEVKASTVEGSMGSVRCASVVAQLHLGMVNGLANMLIA
jgi:hypothetical protein